MYSIFSTNYAFATVLGLRLSGTNVSFREERVSMTRELSSHAKQMSSKTKNTNMLEKNRRFVEMPKVAPRLPSFHPTSATFRKQLFLLNSGSESNHILLQPLRSHSITRGRPWYETMYIVVYHESIWKTRTNPRAGGCGPIIVFGWSSCSPFSPEWHSYQTLIFQKEIEVWNLIEKLDRKMRKKRRKGGNQC